MHRVAVEIEPLVEHRLADARLAVLAPRTRCGLRRRFSRRRLPVRKPTRSATACGSRMTGIDAGLDRLRLRASARPCRTACSAMLLRVQPREVEVIAGVIAGAGAVGAARRHAEAGLARSEVAAVAVGGRRGRGRRARGVKAGAGHLRGAAGREHGVERLGARAQIDVGGRRREAAASGYVERPERRARTRGAPARRARSAPLRRPFASARPRRSRCRWPRRAAGRPTRWR